MANTTIINEQQKSDMGEAGTVSKSQQQTSFKSLGDVMEQAEDKPCCSN